MDGSSPLLRHLAAALALAGGVIACAAPEARGAGAGSPFEVLSADVADLDAYRWQKRPVLVFGPSDADPDYVVQRGRLEAAADGLRERDIVVLSDTVPGTIPGSGGAMRRALGVEGFEIVLVGKDGGVKLRSRMPITVEALFATIDAMPMRRREMAR